MYLKHCLYLHMTVIIVHFVSFYFDEKPGGTHTKQTKNRPKVSMFTYKIAYMYIWVSEEKFENSGLRSE